MASGQRIAVVGVTGAVGQTTLKILEQRKFPVRDLKAYASERSVGKTVTFAGESIPVQRAGADGFKDIDIAFLVRLRSDARVRTHRGQGRRYRDRQVERIPDGSRRSAGGARD